MTIQAPEIGSVADRVFSWRTIGRAMALAGLLTAFHVAGNLAWLQIDRSLPCADDAYHRCLGRAYYQLFREKPFLTALQELPGMEVRYPPVSHLSLAAGVACVGPRKRAAVIATSAWLFLLLAATYLLGVRLAGARVATAAVLLLGFYPPLYTQTRNFLPELPTASMVLVAVLALGSSRGLQSTPWSAVTGLICGLGLLTKYTFPVYLAGPALAFAAGACGAGPGRTRRIVRLLGNGTLAAALAMAVAAPWYSYNWSGRLEWLAHSAGMVEQPYPTAWHDALGLGYYLLGLLAFPGMPFYVLLAAVGWAAMFLRPHPARWPIALWLLAGWGFLTVTTIKWFEYSIPLLAPLALGTAIGLEGLLRAEPDRPSSARAGLLASLALVIAGAGLYLPVTFGIDRMLPAGCALRPGVDFWIQGPGRLVRTELLGLLPDADAALFKGDWYGYSSAAYPLKGILDVLEAKAHPGVVVVAGDAGLLIDSLTYKWGGLGRGLPLQFLDVVETHLYRPADVQAVVVHVRRPLTKVEVTFDRLLQSAGVTLPPAEGGSQVKLRLEAAAVNPTHIVHVYSRLR